MTFCHCLTHRSRNGTASRKIYSPWSCVPRKLIFSAYISNDQTLQPRCILHSKFTGILSCININNTSNDHCDRRRFDVSLRTTFLCSLYRLSEFRSFSLCTLRSLLDALRGQIGVDKGVGPLIENWTWKLFPQPFLFHYSTPNFNL